MDPKLCEVLRSRLDPGDEVEAIIRLVEPGQVPPGVRLVAEFGHVATCRLQRASIVDARADDRVVSLKAARLVGPERAPPPTGPPAPRRVGRSSTDRRRPIGLGPTGAGVVVGLVDWGLDFDHPNFKRSDGATRLLALWDQRTAPGHPTAMPYGYGRWYSRSQIDEALGSATPYAALQHHPSDADRGGRGSHATHVMDIAAGNGRNGGPCGIAPAADLVFVHLADRGTGGLANLGDSVRLLEAIDFVVREAGTQPWVINLSVGRHGGPHDGTTLVEIALDELLRSAPRGCIVQSAGNYAISATHTSGTIRRDRTRTLTFRTDRRDLTPNEIEVWYSGRDRLNVHVRSPSGARTRAVGLGHTRELLDFDRVVGRIYHRRSDPNNGDHHVDIFLDPAAPAGVWRIDLEPEVVEDGRFHAWIERDEACGPCQARFVPEDEVPTSTTGTIANGRLSVVVGAIDARPSAGGRLASFSSLGPTRDDRVKPDVLAPGVAVLAARSAPRGSLRSPAGSVRKSGTSMAAPHVAGTMALCLELLAPVAPTGTPMVHTLRERGRRHGAATRRWPRHDRRPARHHRRCRRCPGHRVPVPIATSRRPRTTEGSRRGGTHGIR